MASRASSSFSHPQNINGATQKISRIFPNVLQVLFLQMYYVPSGTAREVAESGYG